MGSIKGKQPKIDAALGRLADMVPGGNLLAGADPVGFLDTVAAELKDLREENVKLKGTVSIKQDRVNDLEKALRDTLRQLERAINGNTMICKKCGTEMTLSPLEKITYYCGCGNVVEL
jgi:HAMP domain-containing protein